MSNNVNITVGSPPSATILTPVNGSLFRAGDVITFSGSGTDPEDGPLPQALSRGRSCSITKGISIPEPVRSQIRQPERLRFPTTGHDFTGATSYEIILRVTDSTGLIATASVTVFPDKVNLAFDTVPSGLFLEINGISKQTPFVLDELKGFHDTLTAPDQSSGGISYGFVSWSDGGAQSHEIIAPTADQSYIATYEETVPLGLVAAYGFEEGSGTAVIDASGNGNAGTINGATRTTAGRFGNALQFNGTSARVTIPNSTSLRADDEHDSDGVGESVDGDLCMAGRDLQGER